MLTQTQIRAELTQRIVDGLQKGVIAWRKPWRGIPDPVRLPTNFVTKKRYSGINVLSLQLAGQIQSYPTSYWSSFQQWKSVGCQVRKNEKATSIILWKPVKRIETKENGEKAPKTFPIMKTWSVFNLAQVEGKAVEQYLTLPTMTETHLDDADRTEFDAVVAATEADIFFGHEQARYYRPPGDFIEMPDEQRFNDFQSFAETLAHELCHWTESRTGWSGSYAQGELRAEIGSCMLATALGISNSDYLNNHTAYVHSWLRELENDPKYIFQAAAAASKAVDFILNFSSPKVEKEVGDLATASN